MEGNLKDGKEAEKIEVFSDPIGRAIQSNTPIIPGGTLYTEKNAAFYGGYGHGILGKMYSKNDPKAAAHTLTEANLKSWNDLQRFAYKNHTFFFLLGTVLSLCAIGATYYLSILNVLYAVIAFFLFIVPIWYFMQTLFLIEGQSIPGAEYKFFPGIKDVVNNEPTYLQNGKVVSEEQIKANQSI